MALLNIQYEYDGYIYRPSVDREPDNQKIFHSVYKGSVTEGKEVGEIPMSPYTVAGREVFESWIDSGMPDKLTINMSLYGKDCGNPSGKDIINYAIEHTLVK